MCNPWLKCDFIVLLINKSHNNATWATFPDDHVNERAESKESVHGAINNNNISINWQYPNPYHLTYYMKACMV